MNTLSPTLVIKDINGLAVDSEAVAYEGKVLLDVGFFENGDYLWSTALDVLGVAPLTVMNIYRVGAMNTGEVEMGDLIGDNFYDQSHFIREIKQFTGLTPKKFSEDLPTLAKLTVKPAELAGKVDPIVIQS